MRALHVGFCIVLALEFYVWTGVGSKYPFMDTILSVLMPAQVNCAFVPRYRKGLCHEVGIFINDVSTT